MAISLMLPTTTPTSPDGGSPISLPPPTPLSPTDSYPQPPQTANSTSSSGTGDNIHTLSHKNNSTTNTNAKSTNSNEKRKTSRRANTAERRATHNAVERQRRETLNGRFLDLAALLPNLTSVRRPSKSAIVNSSIALVHNQRRQRATAARELRTLYSQFLALKAECDEWRLRAGVPPVEDGERSKDFVSLLELREEEEMGEEERGALRMAMNATANGNGGNGGGTMRSGMSLDDDDDDEIIPHVAPAISDLGVGVGSDGEQQFAHQAQLAAHVQAQAQAQAQAAAAQAQAQAQAAQVQAAQAQAQAQAQAAQYHQLRARASTFSHPHGHGHSHSHSHSASSIPSPVHGHGHHPYAAAYHSIPRPGSHGGLPSNSSQHTYQHQQQPHPSMGQHGHVLPFDNGSDLILASEPHLSHSFPGGGGGGDMFSPTSTSGTGTTSGPLTPVVGTDMFGNGEYVKNEWVTPTSVHPLPHPHPHQLPHQLHHGYNVHGMMTQPTHTHHTRYTTTSSQTQTHFDDGASTHSSTGGIPNTHGHGQTSTSNTPSEYEGASVSSSSPAGSVVGGRSRAGSLHGHGRVGVGGEGLDGMMGGVKELNGNVGGFGVGGGNAVMSVFF